ncbi:MAG TPA: 30S ribosomal protein S21 [Ignavibacteriaceae bacterium]
MTNKVRDGRKYRGITVEVRGDDFGRALRTWSKKVQDSGILKEVKDRMAYEKPAVAKQRMKKQARKRWERNVEEMIEEGLWHKDRKY